MRTKKFKQKIKGFTLVELVITIAIVIILSVVSVPIYQGYTRKARLSEGYALLGVILSAQKAYYSEHGNFWFPKTDEDYDRTNYDEALGVDARGNKYFTYFYPSAYGGLSMGKYYFAAGTKIPDELAQNKDGKILKKLNLYYNITSGATFFEGAW